MPNMVVSAKCSMGTCGAIDEVEVNVAALARFLLRDGLVQTLFPKLDAAARETVMGYRNGWYLCGRCWDSNLGDE